MSDLKRSLIGMPSPLQMGLCAGQFIGDNVARGYVTVDTVNNCTQRVPGNDGYFGATNADATDQNVLQRLQREPLRALSAIAGGIRVMTHVDPDVRHGRAARGILAPEGGLVPPADP